MSVDDRPHAESRAPRYRRGNPRPASSSTSPLDIYRERVGRFRAAKGLVERKASLVANLRLAAFAAAGILLFLALRGQPAWLFAAGAAASLAGFVALVALHGRLDRRARDLQASIAINETGVLRVTDAWHDLPDDGGEFADEGHPYASDLDIFGKASLFQRVNAARTWLGRRRLAALLGGDHDASETEEAKAASIVARQEAVDELARLLDLRQDVERAGSCGACGKAPDTLLAWAEAPERQAFAAPLHRLARLLPYLTLAVFAIDLATYRDFALPIALLGLQSALFLATRRRAFHVFDALSAGQAKLAAFAGILSAIERSAFSSPLLRGLQATFADAQGVSASSSLDRLSRILARTELRHNGLPHFVVNCLVLWDVRCVHLVEEWRRTHGPRVRAWLEAIADFEALSSLATLRFEHPGWAFATIDPAGTTLAAESLRHPLLPAASGIGNDFEAGAGQRTILFTGSNMSGKSTFLRSVAVDLVLAYAGAPSCCDRLTCGLFGILSSMRSRDDLRGKVSTFYAEVLRIKRVVDAVRGGGRTLYLVDEIFSGTNSRDRITGAAAVLRALQAPTSLGLVSTHDLELCRLSEGNPSFANYHFREHYENDAIRFDYRLRPGPSATRNALFLIRMAGVPIED